ncbi:MAG: preprotein translocase subunit YajC [Nitrospira sp.]|nr:preprotein translocase subunit YajC [Candidatus Manganitrophaceae bacterium]HIL34184.1 preprotein translocase subunit YajC [Candidatus Manganitrophaceae bacterium]
MEWLEATAWAQTGGSASGSSGSGPAQILGFVPFILIFILFYFLLVMPQQKRARKQKEMIEALKKGERVSTSGGIIGTVTNLTPKVVTLQVADGVRIKVVRTNIEALADGSEKKGEKGK